MQFGPLPNRVILGVSSIQGQLILAYSCVKLPAQLISYGTAIDYRPLSLKLETGVLLTRRSHTTLTLVTPESLNFHSSIREILSRESNPN